MVFSVFTNLKEKNSEMIAREMLTVLSDTDCKIYFSDAYADIIGDIHKNFLPENELMKKCDIAVAIGGDGTTMKTAKHAAVSGKPTLGINGGRLGFLSCLEKNELDLLKKVLNGEYELDERMMLKAEIKENGKIVKTFHCLNDAVLSRGVFARLIDIKIKCEGRELWSVRSDGVIISTPTGSTAYNLAAGGPIISPDMQCFIITSICPHSLMDRSIVVNSSSVLEVFTSSDVSNNAVITCDGEEAVNISEHTGVTVSLSPYKARLIKIKPENFYEVMKKKIIERRV